jgi:S-adenosylmethionine-diacylgycerolhomoserine-N-methlytransferase
MSQAQSLQKYYRLHSQVYDATRWSFLFGRSRVIQLLQNLTTPTRVLEVGCGTGSNMLALCEAFPNAHITGVDLSSEMLSIARRKLRNYADRVTLIQGVYDAPVRGTEAGFDLVLCSYSLSMFNPGWAQAVSGAKDDLAPGGLFALVDFHDSPFAPFKGWMKHNHVRMDAHLQPVLSEIFRPIYARTHAAYGGLWRYLTFIGKMGPN